MSNFTYFFIRGVVRGVVVRVVVEGFVLGVYAEVWDGWWLSGWLDWGYETFCVDFDVNRLDFDLDVDVDWTFAVDVAFSADCYSSLLDFSATLVITSSLISYFSYLIGSPPTNFPFYKVTLFPFFLLNPLLK